MSTTTVTATVLAQKIAHCDQAIRQGLSAGTIATTMKAIRKDLVSDSGIYDMMLTRLSRA